MFKSVILFMVLSLFSLASARTSMGPEVKKQVIDVLTAGDQLHESFFQYDSTKVEQAAKVVMSNIEKIKSAEIASLLKVTKEKLASIKKDASEEANKENFYIVSLGLGNIVRKYDVGGKWNVYSCPMVKKKWVQNSQKHPNIQNPYAAAMANCGSKDTNF